MGPSPTIADDRIRRQFVGRLMNPLLIVELSEGIEYLPKVGSIPAKEAIE